MTTSSLLIKCLVGTLGVIVLLLGAWGADMTSRVGEVEHRLTVVESHYAAIDARLADLQDDIKEIKVVLISKGDH